MTHAYGPATNLPRLIRELVDPDPRVREAALDTMYGAVHHQGDVYDSTLAAVPFLLRIAATGGLPGRDRVVELLASIGGADWPDTDDGEDDEDDPVLTPEHRDRLRAARRLVADGHEVFVRLLADDDPRVRAAAAGAVVVARTRAAGRAPARRRRARGVRPAARRRRPAGARRRGRRGRGRAHAGGGINAGVV